MTYSRLHSQFSVAKVHSSFLFLLFLFFFSHSLTMKKMNIERGHQHIRSKMRVSGLFLDIPRLIFSHILTEMNVIADIRAVSVLKR